VDPLLMATRQRRILLTVMRLRIRITTHLSVFTLDPEPITAESTPDVDTIGAGVDKQLLSSYEVYYA
jgi:hypothetical protein